MKVYLLVNLVTTVSQVDQRRKATNGENRPNQVVNSDNQGVKSNTCKGENKAGISELDSN